MVEQSRDLLLFLGAGYSRVAQLPTMGEFHTASEKEYAALIDGSNKSKHITGLLAEAGRVYRAFEHRCRDTRYARVDANNVETVFCIAEALQEAMVRTVLFEEGLHSTDYLIEQIRVWLWKVFQQCPSLSRKSGIDGSVFTPAPCLRSLPQSIGDLGLALRTAVITTNYDIVFEYHSWECGYPVHYPLAQGQDYTRILAGDDSRHYTHDGPGSKSPLLCKLHGSINYFFQGAKGVAEPLGICDNIADAGSQIGRSFVPHASSSLKPDERPAIASVDGLWALRARYGSSLVPAIIPPTYAKLHGHTWLRKIWHAAFDALMQARVLVFIGYSLPPSDGFVRALIQGAFGRRADEGPPRVIVIDPDKQGDVEPRYRSLFGTDLVEFCRGGWDSAFEGCLLPAIQQLAGSK